MNWIWRQLLKAATTEDLVVELARRNTAALVATVRREPGGSSRAIRTVAFRGERSDCGDLIDLAIGQHEEWGGQDAGRQWHAHVERIGGRDDDFATEDES